MTAFAYVMMAVYPIGIPAIYTYWLFFRYGKELRLLRSLESEIEALKDELRASTSLSSARMRIRGAKSVWSSSELTKAQGANSSPIGFTQPLPEAVKKRIKMLPKHPMGAAAKPMHQPGARGKCRQNAKCSRLTRFMLELEVYRVLFARVSCPRLRFGDGLAGACACACASVASVTGFST